MYGWCGKILMVDLATGKLEDRPLEPETARQYIGGRGMGIRYLLDHVDPGVDPLSGDNDIVMATGPLTGTSAPTGARYMVMTKSPLTGALTCSNSGGHFPAALKKAGWDAFVLKGRSDVPVYLWLDNGKAELRNAEHLWGKNVPDTDRAIKSETDPGARTAVIGPAGEAGVLLASIMNDKHRAAGRPAWVP